jgi:hypothetical protein
MRSWLSCGKNAECRTQLRDKLFMDVSFLALSPSHWICHDHVNKALKACTVQLAEEDPEVLRAQVLHMIS